jgi:hypothetical protein
MKYNVVRMSIYPFKANTSDAKTRAKTGVSH